MKRAAAAGGLVGTLAIAGFFGCMETGPGEPKRNNGCIDVGCAPVDSARPPVPSAPTGDGGGALGDPLAGTSKQATLLRGRFRFTEGPVWIGGRLLFSDTTANTIQETLADGGVTQFRGNSGGTNGLAVDAAGNLVACEGGRKRVVRGPATRGTQATPIAETFNDAQFNAPNDVIVRRDGNIYFTDPLYAGEETQDDEAVYRIDPQRNVTRVDHDFTKPNGIALSPDGNTLYVVDNGAGKVLRAPVDGAGAVGAFTDLVQVPEGDGMAVDDGGNLYVAATTGIEVFTAAGGKIGTIAVGARPSNCTFGGADRKTLFITANAADGDARTGLYSIVLNVPGLP